MERVMEINTILVEKKKYPEHITKIFTISAKIFRIEICRIVQIERNAKSFGAYVSTLYN